MDSHIIRAVPGDVDAIQALKETVSRGMEHPEYYVTDDRAFVERHIACEGFTLLWREQGELAGFLIVRFPREAPDNLGRDIDLSPALLPKVAHMESAAVLSKFRGHGIQGALVTAAEEIARDMGCWYAMGTVHPANVPSLSTMQELGYEIVATKEKYGGKTRHIIWKALI